MNTQDFLGQFKDILDEMDKEQLQKTEAAFSAIQEKEDTVIDKLSKATGVKYSNEQINVLNHSGNMAILACAGSGKALINYSKVLTPDGYKKIGKLKVGDKVFDRRGKIQVVEGVFPQGRKTVYKVVMSDGSFSNCSIDHLWTFGIVKNNTSFYGWTTDTTGAMISKLYEREEDEKIILPEMDLEGIDFGIEQSFQITPYQMGLLLPNNINTESIRFTQYTESLLNSTKIEDKYKFASIQDRYELLRGLCYTCEKVTSNESEVKCIISSLSKNYIQDIKFICDTLGIKCTRVKVVLPEENSKPAIYKITIYAHDCAYNGRILFKKRNRCVERIVKTSRFEQMTCIKVSDESGLFVLEDGIVTHNTTVLTHLIAKRTMTGEISNPYKVLCSTYSTDGAEEMGTRIKALLKNLGLPCNLTVKTMHATYNYILRQFGYSFTIIDDAKKYQYLNEACKELSIELDTDNMKLLNSLLSFQVNNLMSDDALVKSYVYTLENVSLADYTKIRQSFNLKKQKNGEVDFEDLQLYIYAFMVQQNRQDILEFCWQSWQDFFIDEAQDMSKIQFEILRKMTEKANTVTVIGDDDQCIYQWRGAEPSILIDIRSYYDMERFVLSTNYRCSGDIVKHAAMGIRNNKNRVEKQMVPFKDGGIIRICGSNNSIFEMSKKALKHIQGLLDKNVLPTDIAVLSRNNAHLAILNNMMFKEGIFCTSTTDMRLTKSKAYSDIKNIIEMADENINNFITQDVLYKMCRFMSRSSCKMISDFQGSIGVSTAEALSYLISSFSDRYRVTSKIGDKIKIPSSAKLKMQYAYPRQSDTENDLVNVYNILEKSDKIERIKALMSMYMTNMSEYGYYKPVDRNRTLISLVRYITSLIEKNGINDTKSFLKMTEHYENGGMAVPGEKIAMTTMHRAKGREWKHVILMADDNVSFPSFQGIYAMVEKGVGMSDISASISENRRLHYVAMTRAKEELVLFTVKNNMSVYAIESMGLVDDSYKNAPNAAIIDMACKGEIHAELQNRVDSEIFGANSKFRYDIEVD